MADWNWHIALAKELLPYVNIKNKYDFLLGSIVPDIPWEKTAESSPELRDRSHATRMGITGFGAYSDVNEWIDRYCHDINQYDILKGALTHIVLDNEVNTLMGILASRDTLGQCHIRGVDNTGRPFLEGDILTTKWGNLERFSLSRFGVQDDWLKEKSSWISHDAADIIASCYDFPYRMQDDIVMNTLRRLPTKPRDTRTPDIFTDDMLSVVHDSCKARCLNYLSLLERGGIK